jgi:hypothetical protein
LETPKGRYAKRVEPQPDALSSVNTEPETLESWVQGKLARPVRWGAVGKGLDHRYLARSLPNSEGGRWKRA